MRWVRYGVKYILHHVQDAAAAADDDDDDDDALTGAALTTAILSADHLHSLSRRIKCFLRHQLKSAVSPTSSITLHGY